LTLPENRPLAGRRIVITRAPEQSRELIERLRDAGAETLSLPMVRFLDPGDTAALDASIFALDEFDWLLLTSANAVQFFLARCRKLDRWPRADKPKIAVVGPATRGALQAAVLQAELVPRAFNGAALAAELAPHLPGQHVLLPRSDRAADELPAALRESGAIVTEVVAYRTAAPESLNGSLLNKICHGEVDAAIFFSPSAVEQFAQAIERVSAGETLAQVGARVALAAVGPVTAKALREAGALGIVQASEATSASVVAALARHFVCVGSK
jgi:uroporphyrinogen-III synthase